VRPPLQDACELRTTLPAVPAAVEEFFIEFRKHAQGRLARPHCFAAELLVREALNNAVVHGCRSDPRNSFRCALRLNLRRLTIAVEDSGDGFDWRAAVEMRGGGPAASGRGLDILFHYATRVRFNDKGNAVTIVKRF
jgi:serine/threonine-protein kinase RsbW